MIGHCLCETVVFEIDAASLRLYRCHCSLCRRQSGTASNPAGLLEASAHLQVVAGIHLASRADWDPSQAVAARFYELPAFAQFMAMLHAGDA